VKNKLKSRFIIFFDIKGIVHKELVLAGQTVNPAHYFGDKRNGCCIKTTHHLTLPFSLGNFFTKAT
jgi:hypothetical protein